MRPVVNKNQSSGFTMIELLIATTVFSMVLLVCTVALIQIGKTYYRGITSSQVQNRARAAIDDISQAIQFSGEPVTPIDKISSPYHFCAGDKRYTFLLGKQLESGAASGDHVPQVLTWDKSAGDCGSANPWMTNNFTELLGAHMRLVDLTVSQLIGVSGSNIYDIHIRIIYGDQDLLCSPTTGDCNSNSPITDLTKTDLTCKTGAGSQFCAVSDIRTNVQKRVL